LHFLSEAVHLQTAFFYTSGLMVLTVTRHFSKSHSILAGFLQNQPKQLQSGDLPFSAGPVMVSDPKITPGRQADCM